MEMLCPECMSALIVKSPTAASCSACGEQYDILFPAALERGTTPSPQQQQGVQPVTTTSPSPPPLPEKKAIQCPQCAKKFLVPLTSVGRQARCPCGHVFTVDTPGEPILAPGPVPSCVNHPAVPATVMCAHCGKRICQTCAFSQANGTITCPACMTLGSASANDQAVVALSAMAGGPASPMTTTLPGTKCQRHPQADAVHLCQACRAPVCATCDFSFPGGVHLCPTCAVSPRKGLSPKRKKLVGIALALAIWATAGTVLLFSGVAVEAGEAGAMVIGILVAMPAIIGGGVGLACFERRLGNPPIVWVVAIWNIILLAIMVILSIVGSFM
ncbi:hypothetical protein LCGC14_1423650 [marine sediment metagenome]|uniref:B box-type domain-containing protein n=1 Tax=marine sediment metagenome TaxID=412755 RepID=A0A0F9JR25_9ZZZZ